jgi:type IV pilus assembly protein PilW
MTTSKHFRLAKHRRHPVLRAALRGLTLVELLVSIALMGIVTLASIALYNSSASTYRAVDANQDLQTRARFVFEVITQAVRIAGYEDKIGRIGARGTPDDIALSGSVFKPADGAVVPPIRGYNNSFVPSSKTSQVDYDGEHDNISTSVSPGEMNNSDTLAVRFFGSGKVTDGAAADGSMVDCKGKAHGYPTGAAWGDIPVSLFTLGINGLGEPELSCISLNPGGATPRIRSALMQGIESFQVVYAVGSKTDELKMPNEWRSAQNIENGAGTPDWTQVRWVKVGIVLRSERGSAIDTYSDAMFPLGQDFVGSRSETGLKYTLSTSAAKDGRLRRAFTTIIQLRNPL